MNTAEKKGECLFACTVMLGFILMIVGTFMLAVHEPPPIITVMHPKDTTNTELQTVSTYVKLYVIGGNYEVVSVRYRTNEDGKVHTTIDEIFETSSIAGATSYYPNGKPGNIARFKSSYTITAAPERDKWIQALSENIRAANVSVCVKVQYLSSFGRSIVHHEELLY